MRLITGLQAVREAIRVHGDKLEKVYLVQEGGPQIDAVARFAEGRGAIVTRIARLDLDRMARGARHQGAIAVAPDLALVPLEVVAASFKDHKDAVVVALDEIEDPQNFGAVIRSAVALGATGIVWPEHHAAPLSPATFRASAGAVEHAMLCRVAALPRALEQLHEAGATIIGLDAHAEQAVEDLVIEGPVVLVVGAEGKGLRHPVKRACTQLAKLGMKGPIGSLNASVAAGIALYTVLRRRASEHDASEHDASEHDASEHDASEHDASEHDASEHDASEHDASEHDASESALATGDADADAAAFSRGKGRLA